MTSLTAFLNNANFGGYASYHYIAYVMTSDGDLLGMNGANLENPTNSYNRDISFSEATQAALAALAQSIGYNIIPTGSGGQGRTMYRVREGIERFLITDINNPAGSARAQSAIPVMFDVISDGSKPQGQGIGSFSHVPGGGNVLYMDGHVAFVKYPGNFPVTKFSAWANSGSAAAGKAFTFNVVP